jgi:hypothetical protein
VQELAEAVHVKSTAFGRRDHIVGSMDRSDDEIIASLRDYVEKRHASKLMPDVVRVVRDEIRKHRARDGTSLLVKCYITASGTPVIVATDADDELDEPGVFYSSRRETIP